MKGSVRLSVCLSSVCLSVRPSVTPLSLSSHHLIIMKFSGSISIDGSNVHAKGQGQRSKIKVTKVKTHLGGFRTITSVWIHAWQWNDANSLMWHRKGALLFSRSSVKFQGHTGHKIANFDTNRAFPDCNCSLNSLVAMTCSIELGELL